MMGCVERFRAKFLNALQNKKNLNPPNLYDSLLLHIYYEFSYHQISGKDHLGDCGIVFDRVSKKAKTTAKNFPESTPYIDTALSPA